MDGGTIFTSSVWQPDSRVSERRSEELTLPTRPSVEYWPGMNMEWGRRSPPLPFAAVEEQGDGEREMVNHTKNQATLYLFLSPLLPSPLSLSLSLCFSPGRLSIRLVVSIGRLINVICCGPV